ncbi:hypothetical protein [Leptospira alstonii]|uniref:hypothetical protein n=1 Tax=Leptospira alstonii TaxID=28452 RepID=UPI000774890A|nr:hypothetical protein [Leptospira alstonii]
MKIISKKETEINLSQSKISFETTGGRMWKVWDRFIAIEGKKAFHIGNVCGTCNFFFERLKGANQKISMKGVIEQLSNGSIRLDSDEYFEIEKQIPEGKYIVLNMRINPSLVQLGSESDYFTNEQIENWGVDGFWGLPHYPKIRYYREKNYVLENNRKLFTFIIPLVPETWLEQKVVSEYVDKLNSEVIPTAIALSHIDVKEPAQIEESDCSSSHICFANYLLDGHHKIFASSQTGKAINLITFLAIDEGISSTEEINEILSKICDSA